MNESWKLEVCHLLVDFPLISSKLSLALHVNSLWQSRILGHDPIGPCSSTRSQSFVPLLSIAVSVCCDWYDGAREYLFEVETGSSELFPQESVI